MEKKDRIFLNLKKGEYSFRELPQMKVLDVKLPLSVVKDLLSDFDPAEDRGITAVCGKMEKFEGDPDIFRLTNVRIERLNSNGEPLDENEIECTFHQMNNLK